jgi:hypothetical protein
MSMLTLVGPLQPLTEYAIVCITQSQQGAYSDTSRAFRSTATTACCKRLSVAINSLFPKAVAINALTVSLDPPAGFSSTGVGLTVKVFAANASDNRIDMFTPNSYSFTASDLIQSRSRGSLLSFSASLTKFQVASGNYWVAIDLVGDRDSGALASQYNTTAVRQKTFMMYDPTRELLPLPSLQSVQFSNDGTSLLFTFSSATDRGGNPSNQVACMELRLSKVLFCRMGICTTMVFNPVLAHNALTTELSMPPEIPTTKVRILALRA